MTQKSIMKALPVLGLSIASLVMTSCTDDFERGAKAFLSEYSKDTEFSTTPNTETSNPYQAAYDNPYLETAYAAPVAVTNSPGIAARTDYSSSSSNPTTSNVAAGSNAYEQGFLAGFDQGFANGAKLEELQELKSLLQTAINKSSTMPNPYSSSPAPAATTASYSASVSTPVTTKTSSSSSYKPTTSSSSNKWKSSNSSSRYRSSRNCAGGT